MGIEHTAFYILPNNDGREVWVVPYENGWSLPTLTWPVPDGEEELLSTGRFNKAFAEQFDIDVTTLYAFHWRDPEAKRAVRIFNLENQSIGSSPSGNGRWVGEEEWHQLDFVPSILRSVMDTWFKEATSDISVSIVEPWCRLGWMADVRTWISQRLAPVDILDAPFEQARFWQRSAVLRVKTQTGKVYFKACPKELKQEVVVTDFLYKKVPDKIPNVIAVDVEQNWMLTEEIDGEKLEDISEVDPWTHALKEYAQLQQDSLGFLDELTMCPNWRPSCMISTFENLLNELPAYLDGYPDPLTEGEYDGLRAMAPKFQTLCDEVESYGVPCTLEHCDANGDNFWMGPNGLIVSDWAESCITHPFVGLVNFLLQDEEFPDVSNVKTQFQSAYLEAWTNFARIEKLHELLALIPPLKRLQDALHYSAQFEMVKKKLNSGTVLPHSYAKWTLGQVHSWVPHYLRILLEQGFSGLEDKK